MMATWVGGGRGWGEVTPECSYEQASLRLLAWGHVCTCVYVAIHMYVHEEVPEPECVYLTLLRVKTAV